MSGLAGWAGRLVAGLWAEASPCPGCGRDRRAGEGPGLCEACRARLPLLWPPVCRRCGKPLRGAGSEKTECVDCAGRERYFRMARAAGLYEGELSRLIHRFKFRRERRLGASLAALLAETWRNSPQFGRGQLLVPVPLAPDRLAARGFNQAEELAQALGELIQRPVCPDALVRAPGGPAQSRCSAAGRTGAWGRFREFRTEEVRGRRVCLVDDVLTTGATAEACSLALLKAGAQTVDVLTVATTVLAGRWLEVAASDEGPVH